MGNKVETKARANIKNSSVINRDRANRRKKVGVVERKFEDIKYKRGKSTTKSCESCDCFELLVEIKKNNGGHLNKQDINY